MVAKASETFRNQSDRLERENKELIQRNTRMDISRKFKHQPTCEGTNVVEWFDRVKGSYYEDLEHLEMR